MRVLVSDPLAEQGLARLRAEPEIEIDVQLGRSPEQLAAAVADCQGWIVRSGTQVTAELLAAAPRLRVVGRAGSGVDNIDLQAATARGVVVVNTPGGNSVSVAELTLGAMVACARHLARADRLLKQGRWAKKELRGQELFGKTLGVIGLGRIGREVATRARAFDMRVVGADPYAARAELAEIGVEVVDLDELFARSHVVSLHVPRTAETAHLIDAAALARMRDGVLLLNFARGGLVDEQALLAALESGKVAAASLDAFESEPEPLAELVAHERVLATPHIGASTHEAQQNVGVYAATQVADYLVRGELRNAVNYPSISPDQAAALAPYLQLADRLGAFVSQAAAARMRQLTVTLQGSLVDQPTRLLVDRALAAALRPFLAAGEVNPVNARALAEQRGLRLVEAATADAGGFDARIQVELETDQGRLRATGVVAGADRPPRLVGLDGLDLDAPLAGHCLFLRNDDVPGVIGRIGSYAGDHGVNIVNFALRQDGQGGALALVQLDRRLDRAQRQALSGMEGIRAVRAVDLS